MKEFANSLISELPHCVYIAAGVPRCQERNIVADELALINKS
jgi:hypothetical protein